MAPPHKKELRGGRTKFDKQVTESSKRYLRRQDKDPFTTQAQKDGYRSRAAYKLMAMDDKHHFLRPGLRVADLGAAPGSWCQVVVQRQKGKGTLLAIDKLSMDTLPGATILEGDFTSDAVYEKLLTLCPNGLDVVLSDMAPETSGQNDIDHLRSMALMELAWAFAEQTLKKGGVFVSKFFQGGEETRFKQALQPHFNKVLFEKPPASRPQSRERFIVALGYKKPE